MSEGVPKCRHFKKHTHPLWCCLYDPSGSIDVSSSEAKLEFHVTFSVTLSLLAVVSHETETMVGEPQTLQGETFVHLKLNSINLVYFESSNLF